LPTVAYERELEFVRAAIHEAAGIALAHAGRVTSTIKPSDAGQVLTEADLAIGQYLVRAVSEQFPADNVIDEEAGVVDHGGRRTWVIDPIDGTANFAVGSPLYGILIGLLDGDRPVVGAMALPAFGDVYLAAAGAGAQKNGMQLVAVRDDLPLLRRVVTYGLSGDRSAPHRTVAEGALAAEIALGAQQMRNSGGPFDHAMLAEGRHGAVLFRLGRVWDVVAPQAILAEVGVTVTRFDCAPIDYANVLRRADEVFSFVAAPPSVHAELRPILARHVAATGT
jgi:myo-inositol-1(or 4)-monophosphatase